MAYMEESLENQITNQTQISVLIDAANAQSAHLERMADALETLVKAYERAHL